MKKKIIASIVLLALSLIVYGGIKDMTAVQPLRERINRIIEKIGEVSRQDPLVEDKDIEIADREKAIDLSVQDTEKLRGAEDLTRAEGKAGIEQAEKSIKSPLAVDIEKNHIDEAEPAKEVAAVPAVATPPSSDFADREKLELQEPSISAPDGKVEIARADEPIKGIEEDVGTIPVEEEIAVPSIATKDSPAEKPASEEEMKDAITAAIEATPQNDEPVPVPEQPYEPEMEEESAVDIPVAATVVPAEIPDKTAGVPPAALAVPPLSGQAPEIHELPPADLQEKKMAEFAEEETSQATGKIEAVLKEAPSEQAEAIAEPEPAAIEIGAIQPEPPAVIEQAPPADIKEADNIQDETELALSEKPDAEFPPEELSIKEDMIDAVTIAEETTPQADSPGPITAPSIKETTETETPVETAVPVEKTDGTSIVPPVVMAVPPINAPVPVPSAGPEGTQISLPAEAAPSRTMGDEALNVEQGITAPSEKIETVHVEEPVGADVSNMEIATEEDGAVMSPDKGDGAADTGIEIGEIISPPSALVSPVAPAAIPSPVISAQPLKEAFEAARSLLNEGKGDSPEEGVEKPASMELSQLENEEKANVPEESGIKERIAGQEVAMFDGSLPATDRIALLPFENLSDDMDAVKHLTPELIKKIEKMGLYVVDEDIINAFLCKERVRSTGFVSKELAGKIRAKFNVSYILAGSILSFSKEKNPRFGVLARLIDSSDSAILWADYAAATGEDFETILGIGRLDNVFSLIPVVTDKLFASFKIQEMNKESGGKRKVAIMPLKNNSDYRNAGVIAMYMFMIELLKTQEYVPIEYGNIRNLIISLRIKNKGELSYANMNAVSDGLGARGILVGVVDNYSHGTDLLSPPKVGMTVRLVDARNNKILWYNSDELSGEENVIALDWGRIRSVHSVAYTVVTSLVGKMGATNWQ